MSDQQHIANKSRKVKGGLHVRGLCLACNGTAGRRFDGAYSELHDALGPAYFDENSLVLPGNLHRPRPTPVRIGGAARSMIAAAFALNPMLRTVAPSLPDLLRSDEPFELPDQFDLRLGWATGRRARATGSIGGFVFNAPRVGGLPFGTMVAAQVHFAPIAWQLVFADGASLADRVGWPSIAHWTATAETDQVPLCTAVGEMPMVCLPREHRQYGDLWIELLGPESCFVVECDDIRPL